MRFRLQSSRHERVHETEGQAFHSSQGVGSLHLENEIAEPRGGGVLPPRSVHAHLAHLSSLTQVRTGVSILRSRRTSWWPAIPRITGKMVMLFAPYRIDGATRRPRFKTDVFCLLSLIVFVHMLFFLFTGFNMER